MIKLKKLTLTLAALLSTAAGAWAQTDNVNVNRDGENNKWTFTMPASNVELQVEYVPSYNVTFNTEGLDAEEAAKFTATPNTGVYKDEPVTVTYTGTKRLIGFKAVKKAQTPTLSLNTPTVGQVIGSDGKNYDVADVPDGVTKVAMIAHVSGTSSLAIALADEDGTMNWATAKTTATAHTPTITGITWKLPTQDEWKQMFKANGNDDTSYTGLNNALAAAGGNSSKLQDDGYWSSSETDSDNAYLVNLVDGGAAGPSVAKYNDAHVRACFTF